MTIEKLERANELKNLIEHRKVLINDLEDRIGNRMGVNIDSIKFCSYERNDLTAVGPRRYMDIPEELGLNIAMMLKKHYSDELKSLKEEWNAL